MKSKSLLQRLVIRVSLVTIISILLLMAIVYTQVDRALEALRDQTVEEQAGGVAAHLEESRGVNRVFLNMPNDMRRFYARAGDAYQYLVRDAEGNRLFTSPVAFVDAFPRGTDVPGAGTFEFTGPDGKKFVGYTKEELIGGEKLYIQVAQTFSAADTFSDSITKALLSRLFWAGVPFYGLLLVIIVWTLRDGLKPLQQAANDVTKMDVSDLALRIPEAGVPAEVLPLIRSINYSFGRLERSIREQKELIEDIAHELRTPLTIMKTRIDTLNRGNDAEKLSQDVDAMIKQVNQMLDITRLEYADAMEKQNVDLAEVLSQACQDFFPLFVRARRALRVSGVERPVMISGHKDLIYRAICNLLDNALEYGPAGTPVEAALAGRVITVTDHGKKIPAARRDVIFQRFQKDRSPSAQKSGAGLGLSIVTKTMEAHDGFVDLETSDAGNTFRMVFAGSV